MNGIEPPSPRDIALLPKYVFDARSTDASSHGAIFGASQPAPPFSGSNVTFAPYGGVLSSNSLSRVSRFVASSVGGMRSDNLSDVFGRSTFPPCTRSGNPAWPVYASAGRHVRFS